MIKKISRLTKKLYYLIRNLFSKKFKYDFSKVKNLKKSNFYPINGEFIYNYNLNPETTIVINHFISFKTLKKTIKNLTKVNNNFEIIIINDSGINSDIIFKKLNSPNHKIVSTYNLGESAGYMTGQLLSKSTKYIIFTQDDDLAPSDIKWYIDAKKYFLKYPKLAMIGLNGGGLINFKKNQYYDFSRNRINDKNFYFCSWLKTGPLIINKSRLQEIGGWKMFSKIGESDHFADIDLSLRFCMSGYSIGLLLNNNALKWERRFSRDDGFDKQDLIMHKNRNIRWKLNKKLFDQKYQRYFKKIDNKVINLNKKISIKI